MQNGQDTSDEFRKADKRQQTEAVQFLEQLRPGGPWPLTAIEPDGPTETITAIPAQTVDEFVRRYNGKWNIYYSVNPTRTRMNKKASKTDIAQIEYALADLDPKDDETPDEAKERYLKQLKGDFEPKPTAIIDSGNGIQCLWRLPEPIKLGNPIKGPASKMAFLPEDQAKIADVEKRIEQIMLRLGSKAGTQNIDRILRLPGTTNVPNAKKRKAGRVNCPTKLLRFGGEAYPLDAFPMPKADGAKTNGHDNNEKATDLGPSLNRLLDVDGAGTCSSRSELLFAFIGRALRKGVDEEVIVAACLDDRYRGRGIYEHCRENEDRERGYVKRQIKQAREKGSSSKARRGGRPNQVDLLLEIAGEAQFFAAPDMTAYADIIVKGHRETWAIKGHGFREWLARRFYERHGGGPSSEARQTAICTIEAMAKFEGVVRDVFIRSAAADGKIYLDLANEDWCAVEIDTGGWRVVNEPPVRFRRARGVLALPEPTRGGSVDSLRKIKF
jgi:hypothetical protein